VLKNRDQAVRYYRDFLALGSDQADWNKYAERRLNALTDRGGKDNMGDQLLAVMDTIFRDIIRVRDAGAEGDTAASSAIPLPMSTADLAGEWDWFDRSTVTMRSDGSFATSNRLTGTWRLIDPTLRRYILTWSHGYTDTLTLSQDSRRLEGANNRGTRVWGTRR
jgi:hypothetical protein